MNERIKQLAIQAGFFYEDYKDIWYLEYHNQSCEEEIQEFAQLIVRECMGICYRTDTEYEGHKVKSTVIASKVAEHFGVEE